jgi:hypothetical protein
MGVDKVWCPDPLGLRQSLGVSPMRVMKQGDEEAIPVGPSRIAFKGFPYEALAEFAVSGLSNHQLLHAYSDKTDEERSIICLHP